MNDSRASRDVVFVVHGSNVHTWWRRFVNGGYSWWRRWSLFCDALRTAPESDAIHRFPAARAFDEGGALQHSRDVRGSRASLQGDFWDIREFLWSGANTHEARLEAGKTLAARIAAQPDDLRVHIVSHSHGGNVALVAVDNLPPYRVDSLVLLANPHVVLAEPSTSLFPYWGSAHRRVRRIWNLFSEQDFIQTRGVRWRHGFDNSKGPYVQISRVYEGPGQEAVHNHAIHWKTTFGAHRAMHSSSIGYLVGVLLRGVSFADAIRAAKLHLDAPNGIQDRGGYGGTAWAYQRIPERADPSPFDLNSSGNDVALLLVHGFTASPSEMRPLAGFIQERTAWRCKALLLPGHGTRIEEMDHTGSAAWLDAVQSSLVELAAQCRHVFLVGLSLGAVLCCHAALSQRDRLANLRGLVLMAPVFAVSPSRARVLRILRFFRKRQPKGAHAVHYFLEHKLFSYPELPLDRAVEVLRLGRQAWENLDKLKGMPTLLIAGDLDRNVSLDWMILAAEQHPWIEFVRLPRSRHILTVEPDRTTAFEAIFSFVHRSAVER